MGKIWQKIKQNHLLLIVLCCLVPVILIIGLFSWFNKESSNYWLWLIILLCPLLHIGMMRGHKHNQSGEKEGTEQSKLYQCPECRLEYKEKSWSERCEAWCKKHKSCNLAIAKQAINKYNENYEKRDY